TAASNQSETKARFADTWGAIHVGSAQLTGRALATWIGLGTWLGLTFVQCGREALTALTYNAAFLFELLIPGSLVRTVSMRRLIVFFLTGGFLCAFAIGAEIALAPLITMQSVYFILGPIIEETLKLLPLVWLCMRGRKFMTWTMGATD